MRSALLGIAAGLGALAVAAAPAQAQDPSGPGFASAQQSGNPELERDARRGWHRDDRDHRDHRRRHRRLPPVVVLGSGWGPGPSADWDGNRSWDADRWNDWWHERPWRSYPAWVRNGNGACEPERMWWSGSGWRC